MDVTPVIQRLRERLSDLKLREIEAAAGLDAAMNGNRAAPAIYVIPLDERGVHLPQTGDVDQLEHRVVAVFITVEAMDLRGGLGTVDLDSLRKRIKKALIGWVPEQETGDPMLFHRGAMVDFPGNGRIWWADEYGFTGYFRSEQ